MLRGARLAPELAARRGRFQTAHPRVLVVFLGRAWQGVIPLPAGEDVVTRPDLGDLLDVLEQRLNSDVKDWR